MPYSLQPSEPIADGLKRLAREQLLRAAATLDDRDVDDDTAIHAARKAIKKVRAILRLIVDEIGRESMRADDTILRDLARDLSSTRDASVIVHTFDRDCAPRLDADEADRLRTALAENRPEDSDARSLRASAARRLCAAADRVADWAIDRTDFRAVRGGLKGGYRRVRSAYAAVLNDPSDEHLHDWRKRVKLVWYHERILQPRVAGGPRRTIDDLDQLGDLLGLDHDLSLLTERLKSIDGAHSTAIDRALAVANERRAEIQQRAKALGARLFQQRAKDYVERLRAAWESSRATEKALP